MSHKALSFARADAPMAVKPPILRHWRRRYLLVHAVCLLAILRADGRHGGKNLVVRQCSNSAMALSRAPRAEGIASRTGTI